MDIVNLLDVVHCKILSEKKTNNMTAYILRYVTMVSGQIPAGQIHLGQIPPGQITAGQIPPDKYPPDIYPPLNKVIKYRKIKVHLFKKLCFIIYIHIIYIL